MLQKQEQVLNSLGRNHRLLRRRRAESALDSQQQLGAGQTVQSEILLQAAVEGDRRPAVRVQLDDE
jgi:hypothetical protein